ncbi:MAG: HAD family hydrolase [Candidatus Nanoarchaeia archaeon]|nr:HAD family hydrolase [Candidatus Nanoarchaeia archaeon]
MRKAVFLDRDGVLNKEIDLLHRKEDIEILPGVEEVLKKLKSLGYLLIVISNQPAIARGMITEEGVREINDYLNSLIGNLIDRFYFCPHHPNANLPQYRMVCECRKPAPGLILQAARDYGIDLAKSWMMGDMYSDVATGKAAGCKTILLESEQNKKIIESGKKWEVQEPDYKAKYLTEVLQIIK